jgi:hypothetical protein
MKQRLGLWPMLLRLFGTAALIDVGTFCLAGLFCWLIGWRTWFQYGRVTMIAGLLCAGIGVLTLAGGSASRSPDTLYLESIGHDSPSGHARRIVQDAYSGYRFTIVMSLAGLIAVVAGRVIMRAALEALG